MKPSPVSRGCLWLALALLGLYVGGGVAFHTGWTLAAQACRAVRLARGEFVEPAWSPVVTFVFNVSFWPVYAAANVYHNGTPFATPCTHSRWGKLAPFARPPFSDAQRLSSQKREMMRSSPCTISAG